MEKANQILDFVILRYQKKEYKNFIPRFDWIFGKGLAETKNKMERINQNSFNNLENKNNYDFEQLEKELLAN